MSFESKSVVARLEALEREMMEVRQSNSVISLALIRLTKLVEDAAQVIDAPEGSD